MELDEESYLRIMLEDLDISTDGNSKIEDKANDRDSTAKSGVDGVTTMSLSGNVLTANIQVKKDNTCHPEMLSAKGRVGGVATTSSS